MRKCAGVHLRKNTLFWNSQSQTVLSAWIGSPPYLKVNIAESDEKINTMVLEVLNASTQGVPYPKTFDGLFEPILALAETKSYRTFMKGASCCELELDKENDVITIIPTHNEGSNGFSHLNDLAIEFSLNEKKRIAEKLREAFDLCT